MSRHCQTTAVPLAIIVWAAAVHWSLKGKPPGGKLPWNIHPAGGEIVVVAGAAAAGAAETISAMRTATIAIVLRRTMVRNPLRLMDAHLRIRRHQCKRVPAPVARRGGVQFPDA